MRLHRVRLRNYRGVSDCELEFPTEGVTVVEGDNEVGKSCIPEALDMILNRLDSSSKQPLKDIRPVHMEAGPEVEIEVSSGQYRFTYFKRWHKRPETRLDIASPQREQRLGREAHERVEAILAETVDRDLWKALTIDQGQDLGLPNLYVSSLGQALDLASGGTQVASDDEDLWERICAERARYWTGTGKELQHRKALSESVALAQDTINDLEARLQGIEDDAAEAARLASEEVGFSVRRDKAAEAVDTLNEQWEATASLRSQVERIAVDHTAAQAQLQVAKGHRQGRQEMVEAARNLAEDQASLEAEVEQAAPELALVMRQKEEASNALVAAEDALRIAQDKLRLANSDRDYRRNQIERDQLLERHDRVLAAQKTLEVAEAVLDSSWVDDRLVSQIEKARLEETRARAAFEVSASTVEATALSAQTVVINGKEHKMGAEDLQEAHVTGIWELVIPNKIQVRVKAGHESQDLAADLKAAEEGYLRLCSQGGVQDLAEARLKAEERREAERSRDEAIKAIEENLRDLTSEGLAQKVQGLSERVSSYPTDRQGDSPLPSDFEEAKAMASEAEEATRVCGMEFDRCKSTADTAAENSRQSEIAAAVQTQQLEDARNARKQAEQKLEEARQNQPDSELDEALVAEEGNLHRIADALAKAEKELRDQDPDSLKAKLDNAHNVKAKVEQELRANQDRQRELGGMLEAHAEAGLHSKLNEANLEHQRLEREHERMESRADAALLLYETFGRHRQEALQGYVAPFKEEIEQLGRIVFGPTFEVELDEDLRVVQRTLDGITLDLEQLSVGAREQIGVICRLACATIVSPDGGGAPVMIDDALGWSDPSRLQNMGAAIAAAGQDCQVIVLTCTPGRYANVGNASVVRLPN